LKSLRIAQTLAHLSYETVGPFFCELRHRKLDFPAMTLMQPPTQSRAIVFADLRGSTALFESLGNAEATAVVTQCVAMLGGVVKRRRGRVIKTLGDGLMAVFGAAPDAVEAADDMHHAMELWGADEAGPGDLRPVSIRGLRLQVGVAHGEVVEMAGDVFGDAVNVAARLLDHAGDNETLVTLAVVDAVKPLHQSRFRSLDRMQLRGRVEAVHVYLQETHRLTDSATTAYGDIAPAVEPSGIRLTWLDMKRIYSGPTMPLVLGRSPQANYCIDDSRVSRSHARIDWHGGAFQLTDLSYNGTYVRFSNESDIIGLRRGNCTLHGSGVIGLGASPLEATTPTVRFEVLVSFEPPDAAERQPNVHL
jgi:adenylate cyclase